MPVTAIQSKWDSGALVFHDKGDYGVGAEVLRIAQAAVTIGTATNSVDLSVSNDLLLANGSVINFDSGDVTITHSTDKLTVASTWTAGAEGRPFGVNLTLNVRGGNYVNALKGYVECGAGGGTTGLLSAVNCEIKMPDGSCQGAYYPLEVEWVGQGSTAFGTPGTGSQSGLIYIAASGTVTDLDSDGVFMSLNGLSPGIGKLFSVDMHTLRCTIDNGTYTKYLVMSIAENYLSHDFSAVGPTGRIARWNALIEAPATGAGEGLFNITVSLTGEATAAWALTSTWLNIGAAAGKLKEGDYFFLHSDGIWQDAASDITNSYIAFQKYEAILAETPGHLHIWNMNLTKEITALIEVNDPAMLGFESGSSQGSVVGTIPLYTTGLGAIKYIAVYSLPGGG